MRTPNVERIRFANLPIKCAIELANLWNTSSQLDMINTEDSLALVLGLHKDVSRRDRRLPCGKMVEAPDVIKFWIS